MNETRRLIFNGHNYDLVADPLDGSVTMDKLSAALANAILIHNTLSGDVVSFKDGSAGLTYESLKMSIEPTQEGSGTPSALNPRPIHGLMQGNIYECGKNLIDINGVQKTPVYTNPGDVHDIPLFSVIMGCAGNGLFNPNQIDYVTIVGNDITVKTSVAPSSSAYGACLITKCKENTDYYLSSSSSGTYANYIIFDKDKTAIRNGVLNIGGATFNSGSDAYYLGINLRAGAVNTARTFSNVILNEGTSAESYESFNKKTRGILLDDEIYMGEVDFNTGILQITGEYIASYNGEAVNPGWICSEALYGTDPAPVTGSEVVNPLSTPIIRTVTAPAALDPLTGDNTVFSNNGAVELQYVANTKLYIDNH